MNEKVERHAALCNELNALYERKNHDYGDSFHQTFVEEGMAMPRIRLGDKFSRFKTLSQGGDQQVSDESIRDTLMDLANYALMTILEMDISAEEAETEIASEDIDQLAISEFSQEVDTINPDIRKKAVDDINKALLRQATAEIEENGELSALTSFLLSL